MDLDDLVEDLTLDIKISAKGEGSVEESYDMTVQRETYSLDILSVEVADHVGAGGTIAVDVVVQNYGQERLDNVYVKASIPELGVSRKVYAGDLSPYEEEEYDDIRDSVNKRVYLTLPRNAMPGTYEMEVEVYNYDAFTSVVREVVVEELETGVLATKTSRTIAPGEETTFDVVLVNPNERMVLYTLTPEDVKGLLVEMEMKGRKSKVAVIADDKKRQILTLEDINTKLQFDMAYDVFEGFTGINQYYIKRTNKKL